MFQNPGKNADWKKRGPWHALLGPLLAAVEALPAQENRPLWLIETALADALRYLTKLREQQINALGNYDILPRLRGIDPEQVRRRTDELPYHLARTTRPYDTVGGWVEATWDTISGRKRYLIRNPDPGCRARIVAVAELIYHSFGGRARVVRRANDHMIIFEASCR